ncbi:MAG: permease-like cell division protein FtsX [Lactobacillales bacterium]|jgi:cell division transport system permease protein|nr:permease-like cell division protein FtsX [Lactobacillales bacterium]
MISTLIRHIGESIKSLKRNGWMSIASVSAVSITLILVGVFLGVIMNISSIAKQIEENVAIGVYVQVGTDSADLKKLEDNLKKIKHVDKIEFSSKDDELADLKKEFDSEAWSMFDGDANPLHDKFTLYADSPAETKEISAKVSKLDAVYEADYGGADSDKLFAVIDKVQLVGGIIAVLLLLVAMFLISNTIRITIMSRQREIEIMRLVGARNSFIRWPFLFEGGWIGLLGAIVPVALVTGVYRLIFSKFNGAFAGGGYSLINPNVFLPEIIIVMLAVGVVIGSLGSMLSMTRYLRK